MNPEHHSTRTSLYVSTVLEAIRSVSRFELLWGFVCLLWCAVAVGVVFFNFSSVGAFVTLGLSYAIVKSIEIVSEPDEREFKTGLYHETCVAEADNRIKCVECGNSSISGTEIIGYKVVYLGGYEIARLEEIRNAECADCNPNKQDEETSTSTNSDSVEPRPVPNKPAR